MMKKTMYLTGLMAMSALLSTYAQSVMVSNYENNTLQGWHNGVTVVAAPDASLGSFSMLLSVDQWAGTHPSLATWDGNSQLNWANLNAGSQISFDLYFPSAGWLINHAEVSLEVWGGDPWVDAWGTQNLTSITKDSVIHMTYNLSSFSTPRPAATWGGIDIFVKPGYDWLWDGNNTWNGVPYTAQQVYIDNVQIITPVPEPSTMALATLGGAALLFWRRRSVR